MTHRLPKPADFLYICERNILQLQFLGKIKAFFMNLAGFPLHSKWTSEEYLKFLQQNDWTVRKSVVLKASFPLTYTECVKSEV